MTHTSACPTSGRTDAYAMRVPSYDQSGTKLPPGASNVSRRAPVPSASIVQISFAPLRDDVKAIRAPSRDHAG